METTEIYFRELERLVAREVFLEKEMLDADVHHLEVRTGFFDKLAVLAAGSLALGISFMASGSQRDAGLDSYRQSKEAMLLFLPYLSDLLRYYFLIVGYCIGLLDIASIIAAMK